MAEFRVAIATDIATGIGKRSASSRTSCNRGPEFSDAHFKYINSLAISIPAGMPVHY
jgi:hypothetical protein